MKYIILLVFTLIFFGCSQNESNKASTKDQKIAQPKNGTAQMVNLLRDVHSKIDPMKVGYHLNSSRAEHMKTFMQQSKNDSEMINAKQQYGYELLQSGKTHEAIMQMEQLLEMYQKLQIAKEHEINLRYLLGLAYLRLGEQENCIGKNNEESCIIPIQGDGVYTMKTGSETAISIFESILKDKPDSKNVLWLLNIAYMTIGEYPDGVPSKWRVPPSQFESDYKMPAFKNIANKTAVGTSALAGGSCVEDFNNDGLLDIVASSWGVNDQIRVFFNQGDGRFIDKTSESGLVGINGGLNMIHADYNNDGFEDVWFCVELGFLNKVLFLIHYLEIMAMGPFLMLQLKAVCYQKNQLRRLLLSILIWMVG